MAKERSEQQRIEKAMVQGRENAALWPRVEAWCRHLEIKMLSAGMLAEMYQLPIGRIEITCPHAAHGGIGAHNLCQVAAYFVTENCRGCPHHEEMSPDNVGRTILAEAEALQRSLAGHDSRIEAARMQLRELVSGDLSLAFQREPTTQQSILELVALLEDETHHHEAAKKLVLAAEVAPELFSPLAREVICSHFPNLHHGRDCIACMRMLGKRERAA